MTAFVPVLGQAVAMAIAGVAFGLTYFATLRRSVAALAGGGGWVRPLALTLARLGAAVVFLALAAKLGAAALIAAFLGFLLARTIALRAARRAA